LTKILKTIGNINIIVGVLLIAAPIAYLLFLAPAPTNVEAANTPEQETVILTNTLSQKPSILTTKPIEVAPAPQVTVIAPPVHKVTDKQYIKIPSIGLDTQVYQGPDAKTLDKGVWLMPGHGTPEDMSQPIVLAAHRWGPDNATYEYRKKNLFYNLPTIRDGDVVTINWNGQDYKYKVIYKEENQYVSRYADLIMFTCKYYNSPIRIFVYAQRIQ